MSEHFDPRIDTARRRISFWRGCDYIRSSPHSNFANRPGRTHERRETDLRTIAELMGQLEPAGDAAASCTRAEA